MKHGKPTQWKVERSDYTVLNMLVELNAEEKYRALHEDSNLSKVLKST